jgi:hypothetical protein
VVDVEQCALRAFQEHALAARERVPDQSAGVGEEGYDALSQRERFLRHLFGVGEIGGALEARHGAGAHPLDAQGQGLRIHEIAGAHAGARRLVLVGRADAAARRAHRFRAVLALALGEPVVGQDEMRVRRQIEPPLGAHAQGREVVQLLHQGRGIDHDAVADHAALAFAQDARGHEVEHDGAPIVHHAVPGVGASLIAHDPVVLAGQKIDDLALALVAPLGADDDGGRHG